MVVGQKVAASQCNFSHQDQIWKDYVRKEISVARKRDRDYAFLNEEYQTLLKDVFQVRARHGLSRVEKPKDPETLKLPALQVPPQDTSNPFPSVTSREIGWRSARKHNLEVYGRWGRPRYSIIKQLKWPVDAVP